MFAVGQGSGYDSFDAIGANDARDTEADIFDMVLALQKCGDGENAMLIAEDGGGDSGQGEAYSVISRAFVVDDVVGRVTDALGDIFMCLFRIAAPAEGAIVG